MPTEFAIVDLFAGPGGLAEGFASIRDKDGSRPFKIALSVEKESSAFETLRFRSFFRQFDGSPPPEYYQFLNGEIAEPNWSLLYPLEWELARSETMQLELGSRSAAQKIDQRLEQISKHYGDNTILIGGPPCQAYSLVGRARNKGIQGYEASKDHRHFLYREYIRILQTLMPAVFVMENVKGMLSSAVDGERIFDQVIDDLRRVGSGSYRLVPLAPRSGQPSFANMAHPPASDFVVRAEDHGIPQSRHRVIVVGVRSDIAVKLTSTAGLLQLSSKTPFVADVLRGMPKLRSGLSDREDDEETWRNEVCRVMRDVARLGSSLAEQERQKFGDLGTRVARRLSVAKRVNRRGGGSYANTPASCPPALEEWLVDSNLKRFPNNETRGHMVSDLRRHFYAALFGRITHASPKAKDFPRALAPDHRNWRTGKFADRFRVQLTDPVLRTQGQRSFERLAKQIRLAIRELAKSEPSSSLELDELNDFFASDESRTDDDEGPERDPRSFKPTPIVASPPRQPKHAYQPGLEEDDVLGPEPTPDPNPDPEPNPHPEPGPIPRPRKVADPILLQNERNLLPEASNSRRRRLFFTSPVSGDVSISVDATGLSTAEALVIVGASRGVVEMGALNLTCALSERVSVDVEFDRPYVGPIELSARRMRELEKDAVA